jgi:hypothetical protein
MGDNDDSRPFATPGGNTETNAIIVGGPYSFVLPDNLDPGTYELCNDYGITDPQEGIVEGQVCSDLTVES